MEIDPRQEAPIFFQLESFVDKTTFNSCSFNNIIYFITTQYAIQYFCQFYFETPWSLPNENGMDKDNLDNMQWMIKPDKNSNEEKVSVPDWSLGFSINQKYDLNWISIVYGSTNNFPSSFLIVKIFKCIKTTLRRGSIRKVCSQFFFKIHRKTLLPESRF